MSLAVWRIRAKFAFDITNGQINQNNANFAYPCNDVWLAHRSVNGKDLTI